MTGAAQSAEAAPRAAVFAVGGSLLLDAMLGVLVGLAALALAARDGDAAAAAFALVTYVVSTLQILLRVVSVGASVMITQSLGAGRRDTAAALARAALTTSVWLGAAVAVATFAAADPLLRLAHAPADVLPLSTPLLRGLAAVLVLDACSNCLSNVLRAHLHAPAALRAIVVTQVLQLALAVPLMRGIGPLAPLGLTGFAVAALIARSIGVGLQLRMWRTRLGIVPRLRELWRIESRALAPLARIGLPGAGEDLVHLLAFMASVAAVGSLGTRALATHGYLMEIGSFLELYGWANGLASEIFIGHLLGAGRVTQADQLARQSLRRGAIVSLGLALAAAATAPWLLGAFTGDPWIRRAGGMLLWLGVVHEPARNFNLVYGYALRAAGDGKYPMLVGGVSMVLVLAGGSWLLGGVLGLGLPGVWLAYTADEWVRGLLMMTRWRARRWLPRARALLQSLEAGGQAAGQESPG
jgi:Na+-driven multidrug efflux pump